MTKRGGTTAGTGNGDGEARGPGRGQTRITPELRLSIEEACREAIASGVGSRNSIARAFEVGASTVTRICKAATPPIVWDRSATAQAVEARAVDMKAERQRLAADVLADITRVRERFFDKELPHSAFSVAMGVTRWDAPASPNELRDLATAFGILVDKHLVLVRADSDDRELSAVDAWLESVMPSEAS